MNPLLSSASSARISRRDFLLTCGRLGLLAGAGLIGGTVLNAQEAVMEEVPPTLMLHSRDNVYAFQNTLIKKLKLNNYKPTTYLAWEQAIADGTPHDRSVILTIDDISMARGNRSFPSFRQMHDTYKDAGMVTVFAVITRPDLPQDETKWDEVAEWVREGFELATHTSYHTNLSMNDSTPRSDLTEADYTAEIVDSAQLIEEKMQARGINYKVRTLVTPFGSGYSHAQPIHEIHPGVATACAKTNIKFVVGMVAGKLPIERASMEPGNDDLVYLGRTPPFYDKDSAGKDVPQGEHTFGYLNHWYEVKGDI
jgi:hypothetical protein